ncbi:glycine betaine ABC transporter substrate-binding protein [Geotoga petraea]|jgi:glycine betaine/proline transport system substrate-binding protein|uniref:Glycine betaine/proline transport system substrate-binding protein n=1 Tax=Geotoga petraea TaxID=28234 RepID=A0A1G6JF68_9BACT|nr:glycine betaine ABC transporter substrate-binding protein [Geotoga petraea]SDC17371.1 glycine betaine/proline transport system substrate-binding protein [Geotoga petraea]
MKKLLVLLSVLVLSIAIFAAGTVKIAYVNWAEGIAMTNLAKVILVDEMGYEVEDTMADPGLVYASLAQGDQDVFMDGWLPITHESYMNQFGDELTDLGYNFKGARIGLVVPTYVNIDSITELNSVKEKFDSQIVGIDSGAGIMAATERAIDAYDLELELRESSGPVMTATLADAIDNDEWVVVTGWSPHWMFARFDVKFLEDPEGVYGAVENIHSIARRNFIIDMPEVAQFFTHFFMTESELGSLMGVIADSNNPEEAARQWKEEHMDIVEKWIPNK